MLRKILFAACAIMIAGGASSDPLTTAFNYQGKLDLNGSPVSGSADFQFTMWDAPQNGVQIGLPVPISNVSLSGGVFTVQLDFGADAFPGEARWLEVRVRTPHDPTNSLPFTAVAPRQPIISVPYALQTRGIFVDGAANVGIGTTAPAARLHVTGGADASPAGGGFAIAGDISGANIAIDSNEIMARNNGAASALLVNREGGDVAINSAGGGGLGVGTSAPTERLDVIGNTRTTGRAIFGEASGLSVIDNDGSGALLRMQTADATETVLIEAAEAAGNGAQITLRKGNGLSTIVLDAEQGVAGGQMELSNGAGTETVEIASTEGGVANGASLKLRDAAGRTSIELDAEHGASGEGRVITDVLEITGGSDFAEPFDVSGDNVGAGMVVVIDPDNPGDLALCSEAYDRKVAGIISGAGGLRTGLVMAQTGTTGGEYPIALSGRVHCMCDAADGPIRPGDLLTTSTTPGHAMKVSDYTRSQGAIIGKAITSLESGRGLVLVLVSLQ